MRALLSTNSCQPATPAGLSPCARSISSSTSRRPAESAASSTRPGNVSRKSSSGASGRSARRSTRHSCGAAVGKLKPCRFVFDLEALEIDAREGVEPRLQFLGRQVQLFGREHRALDVVPPFLVALGDAARGALHGGGHLRARRTPRCPPVDSRAACRWCRRTAAGRTRCPAARGRRSRRDRSRSCVGSPSKRLR